MPASQREQQQSTARAAEQQSSRAAEQQSSRRSRYSGAAAVPALDEAQCSVLQRAARRAAPAIGGGRPNGSAGAALHNWGGTSVSSLLALLARLAVLACWRAGSLAPRSVGRKSCRRPSPGPGAHLFQSARALTSGQNGRGPCAPPSRRAVLLLLLLLLLLLSAMQRRECIAGKQRAGTLARERPHPLLPSRSAVCARRGPAECPGSFAGVAADGVTHVDAAQASR
jgi:hypothetical protein